MPDENINPVGTAQMPQEDQATSNQTGDDFVLDFGGGENENESNSPKGVDLEPNLGEINNGYDTGDSKHEVDLEFDDNIQDGNFQENNINIQDLDSIFNETQNEGSDIPPYNSNEDLQLEGIGQENDNDEKNQVDINQPVEEAGNQDFTVSLDETEERELDQENEGNDIEDSNIVEPEEENSEEIQPVEESENQDFTVSLDETEERELDQENEGNDIEDSNNAEPEEENSEEIQPVEEAGNQDFTVSLDETEERELHQENEGNDIEDSNNVESKEENSEKADIEKEEPVFFREEINSAEDNLPDKGDSQGISSNIDMKKEEILPNYKENPEYEVSEEIVNDTENSTENENNNPIEPINDENTQRDIDTENLDSELKMNDNTGEALQQATEENPEHKNEGLDANLDFKLDEDENVTIPKEIKQPEIGDLIDNGQLKLELANETDTQNDEKDNLENSTTEVDKEDLNQIIPEQEMNKDNIIEDGDVDVKQFSLDYGENKQENNQNNYTMNEIDNINNNVETSSNLTQSSEIVEEQPAYSLDSTTVSSDGKLQESLNEENVNYNEENLGLNQSSQVIDSESNVENPEVEQTEIATLSLDEILDSELNNNPQYATNSESVPTNVASKSGFFNKKVIGIAASVLLFCIAGYVAILAFPLKSTERKPGDVTISTGSQIEEVHNAGGDINETEDLPEVEEKNETNPVKTKVSFPDVEGGEEWLEESETEESEYKEPEPYYCVGDECLEDYEAEMDRDELSADEIMQTISDFKEYAESNYLIGDEAQDKKLVRYSLQIINLCNIFQEQFEDEGNITRESFEEFKSNAGELRLKIEKYISGGDEIQVFTQSNFNDEYNFEGKDELREYINNRDIY